MTTSPVADLSYRDYDGPLIAPRYRWWVIAKATLLVALRKRVYWVFTALSGVYYMALLVVIFFVDQLAQNSPNPDLPLERFMSFIVWKDQFLHGFAFGQIWFLSVSLLVGAGSIANDNRANALLVYLSKPCTKRDYLLGKWMGVWLALLIAMGVPTLLFFGYAGLSYTEFGFFSDRWLILRILALLPLGAAFYASLAVGISSLFHNGRLAGATLFGLYILSYFFTALMAGVWQMTRFQMDDTGQFQPTRNLVGKLFYASIDGLEYGLAKAIYGTRGSPPFGIRPSRSYEPPPIPELWVVLAFIVAISALALFVAWRRIRAVEVVR